MRRVTVLLVIFLGIFQISYGNTEIDNRIKEINKIVEKIDSDTISENKKTEVYDNYTKYYDKKNKLIKISKGLGQSGQSNQENYYIDKNKLIKYSLKQEFPILDANPPAFYRKVLEYYFNKSGKLIAIISIDPDTGEEKREYNITKKVEEEIRQNYKNILEKSK